MQQITRIGLTGILALGIGCAPLNTAKMTPACREIYQGCLNLCPQPSRSAPEARETGPAMLGDRNGSTVQLDFDGPACVEKCNSQARKCE